ncbi:DUF2249 domain-containing protein [Micromonospora coerulea]|uniref:DUF2249 domain-containing protein n=1 Tax=Micromonospora coerulea TaxID=47856 RepID=UPI001904A988|nr:DUF2249 domain-containing protein [Micromonospora veneta]
MSHSEATADRQAAEAVVRHHAALATTLDTLTGHLMEAADRGDDAEAMRARDELVRWLHAELLPHVHAEETAMYPAAAALAEGKLLADGMLGEHQAIVGLVSELAVVTRAVPAAAAARALAALFAVHLDKENDLVVPLLVGAADVSLAGLLAGMHDLLGAAATAGGGGCGGSCGCGGDAPASGGAAEVLSIDPRLDVRDLPHGQRHATVLAALDRLQAGDALVLVAPHAPRPLLAEIDQCYGGAVTTEWLQDGPQVWQIRLSRTPAPV